MVLKCPAIRREAYSYLLVESVKIAILAFKERFGYSHMSLTHFEAPSSVCGEFKGPM